uniref:tetrahydrofolate synthase n=1 Tax=candidate division WOR-3 bacterium TaxID=2052148 RepID=A0A7C3YPX3_UNCW3
MNYWEVNKILYSLINYERDKAKYQEFKLEKFKNFLKEISHPEEKLSNVILIAGTKGKGSTATMLSNCLTACGIKTGLFTSPHLLSWRERIRINNQMIPTREFCEIFSNILPLIKEHKLTFFETLTAIAFLYFLREKTEWTVLEVGLGGRLDATNVVSPRIAIITRIGFDHTELLGETLTAIAREKAGIIHPNSTVVTFHQTPEVLAVIKKQAKENESKVVTENLIDRSSIRLNKFGSSFKMKGEEIPFFLPLLGAHQVENVELVLAALSEIKREEKRVSWEKVREGLKRVYIPARCELISSQPPIMIDCAHNPDSAFALKEVIEKILRKRALFVFGVARDKKVEEMLEILSPVGRYFFTQARHPRALPIEVLASYGKKLNLKFSAKKNVAQAIKTALANQGKEILVITGSFYVVGEALRFLKHHPAQ